MSKPKDSTDAATAAEDSPVAWFVVLERARQTGDIGRAAEALRQLSRLGVEVTYTSPPMEPKVVAGAG